MTRYLLAGGGTAGHVNPMLSLADAIRRSEPGSEIWMLGTAEGLEAQLVPQRGYNLLTIERLPFPRRLGRYALGFPARFLRAVKRVRGILQERKIDVVVGFGGYASAPAYEAARRAGVPIVIHEANALPGYANRVGARYAKAVAVAFRSTKLRGARFIGMPLRPEIEALVANPPSAAEARKSFGLAPDTVTLLVVSGSLGAKRINAAIDDARTVLSAAGIQVLHIMGARSELEEVKSRDYVRLRYCDRMDLAIAAASLAISRAGASTVAEFTAAGLAAIYVPYPVGNGEQRHNVRDVLAAGGGILLEDEDFTPEYISNTVIPLMSKTRKLDDMRKAAKAAGTIDAADQLYRLVRSVLGVAELEADSAQED